MANLSRSIGLGRLKVTTKFPLQVLEAWSSGLNDTGYENVTSLLKNNCKREIIADIGAPILTLATKEANQTNGYECDNILEAVVNFCTS